ncbi:MAG: non-heme iron oxygenase ferredoxin subunit [Candidatus Caldarchaeum sp.]|nr:non-heme iron oxygenase ferredoxin subunit [Candidatus Caldarchaeum sp.]
MPNLLKVCRSSDLTEGDSKVITYQDEQILVLRHAGKVYAVSNICTHDYAELVNGLVFDKTITCPVHLSRFKLETGEVLNPPATKPLKTYPIHVVEDEIFVEV